MNEPEQLFPGLKWQEVSNLGTWYLDIGAYRCSIHTGYNSNVWWGEVYGDFSDCADLSTTLDWLRARIIERRNELCRVTGGLFIADYVLEER